jgi:molecular chaperone GrpE
MSNQEPRIEPHINLTVETGVSSEDKRRDDQETFEHGGSPDFVQTQVTSPDIDMGPTAVALQAELTAAEARVAEHYEALLRARAEMENIRRRAAEDISKAHKFGIESFAESLIPVKDSLELALADTASDPVKLREGVQATLRQLVSAFEKNHLKEIAPSAGDKFDPHLHQGISMVASELPERAVVSTLQKGAMIADRVLRPALVAVSSGVKSN